MYYGTDLGRYHRADLMREAEGFRLSKETAKARATERRATVRKVFTTALTMLAVGARR
jgi:hypothetical protein